MQLVIAHMPFFLPSAPGAAAKTMQQATARMGCSRQSVLVVAAKNIRVVTVRTWLSLRSVHAVGVRITPLASALMECFRPSAHVVGAKIMRLVIAHTEHLKGIFPGAWSSYLWTTTA